MKKRIYKKVMVLMIISLITSCSNSNLENENRPQNNVKIESEKVKKDTGIEFLNNFYKEYHTVINEIPINETKYNNIKQKYCSNKLINMLDTIELDYDPFINAQDIDPNFSQINVFKLNDSEKGYHIYFGNNKTNSVKLYLINNNDKLLIDSIADLN